MQDSLFMSCGAPTSTARNFMRENVTTMILYCAVRPVAHVLPVAQFNISVSIKAFPQVFLPKKKNSRYSIFYRHRIIHKKADL